MFHEEYTALCNAGVAKNNLLKKNPLGYFISSMVAGMFISFGSMVAFVLGQSMDGNGAAAAVKLIQSVAFASALSLVVMAGAELFTGNNLVMAAHHHRRLHQWQGRTDHRITWYQYLNDRIRRYQDEKSGSDHPT